MHLNRAFFIFSVAFGRVKLAHLNSNLASVLKEFYTYTGFYDLCTCLVFLDKKLLQQGLLKIWCEIVQKNAVPETLSDREGHLLEVPESSLSVLRIKPGDMVHMSVTSKKMLVDGEDTKSMRYLASAFDNHRSFLCEPSEDSPARQFATLKISSGNVGRVTFKIEAKRFLPHLRLQGDAAGKIGVMQCLWRS